MRRVLGILLLTTLLLAGCGEGDGDGGGDTADDPAPSAPSSTAPSEPAPSNDWRLVGVAHATAAGGEVSLRPTPVNDPAEVADFSLDFTRPQLEQQILRVVAENPPEAGRELVAAVVSIGCDVPTAVTYANGEVRAMKVADPLQECFAPVTSVAVLEVPA